MSADVVKHSHAEISLEFGHRFCHEKSHGARDDFYGENKEDSGEDGSGEGAPRCRAIGVKLGKDADAEVEDVGPNEGVTGPGKSVTEKDN